MHSNIRTKRVLPDAENCACWPDMDNPYIKSRTMSIAQ
jgi:hypothetical protein